MSDPQVKSLIEAIVDRRPLTRIPPDVRTPDQRSPVRALEAIQAIADAAPRAPQGFQSVLLAGGQPRFSTMVTLVSRVALGCAVVQVSAALLGLALGYLGTSAVPVIGTLVAFFGFGVCAVWLLAGGARDFRARALGCFYLVIVAAFGARFIPESWALLHMLSPTPFLPLFLWTFVSDFPRTQRTSRFDALCLWGVPLAAALGVLLLVGNWLVASGVAWVPQSIGRSNYTFGNIYWTAIFVMMVLPLGVLLGKRRLAAPGEQRRAVVFTAGFGLVLLFVAVEILAEIFIPSFLTFMTANRAALTPVFFGVLLLQPAATTYAVLVDRVLDVKTALSRGARYLLARHVLIGLGAVPVALLIAFLYVHRSETIGAALSDGIGLALVGLAIGGAVLTMLRDRAVRYLDEHFERTPIDWAGETAMLTAAIGNARTIAEAIDIVELSLARCLGVDDVQAYRVNASRSAFDTVDGRGGPIAGDAALFALLCSDRMPVMLDGSTDDVRPLLPPADLQWCASTAACMLVPVFGSADSPLGAIAVGAKKNGDSFLLAERTFAGTIAAAVALKLEGAESAAETAGGSGDGEAALMCDTCRRVMIAGRGGCECGGRLRPASIPALLAGKFTPTAYIGAGAMGVVYRALDTTLNRPVALKTLGRLSGAAADRLAEEARIMAAVAHPNLATIYSVERWRRTPILVLEFLDRGSLASRLRQPMPIDDVLRLGVLLAPALEQLHQAHILHRDIKPTNIGFTRDEAPKLLDFGLASFLTAEPRHAWTVTQGSDTTDGEISRTQALRIGDLTLAGTPLYLPPEALAGAAPSPAFDLWALALVLFEAIAGRHPFAAGTVSGVLDNIRRGGTLDLSRFRADCPPAVAAAFRRLLAPDAAQRCPSAAHLRAALEELLASSGGSRAPAGVRLDLRQR